MAVAALPLDLVLVRHGQSEGNAAKRLSEKGDHTAIRKLKDRHTASFRLTEIGRRQAGAAGAFLQSHMPIFDRYYTSEYVRAMETAGLLNLQGATWYCDFYVSERDWGALDVLPEDERQQRFGAALRMRDVQPFFWRPPNGESFAQLCLRVDRMLYTLSRECVDKRVIIVCHGEVMWAFRVRLERMSQVKFKELHLSKRDEDRIQNCQILHYTRKNPATGKIAPYANWMRSIRPTQSPLLVNDWQQIERPRYSNEDLLSVVSRVEPMVA